MKLTVVAGRDEHVKILLFTRNFGKEAAMSAASDYASIVTMIPIEANLQDPLELINDMPRAWLSGFAVVSGFARDGQSDGAPDGRIV